MIDERGGATLLAVLLAGLLLFAGVTVLTAVGQVQQRQHQAQTAADLAALAAAGGLARLAPDPCESAHRIGTLNGSTVSRCAISYREGQPVVEVVVRAPPLWRAEFRATSWATLRESGRG